MGHPTIHISNIQYALMLNKITTIKYIFVDNGKVRCQLTKLTVTSLINNLYSLETFVYVRLNKFDND